MSARRAIAALLVASATVAACTGSPAPRPHSPTPAGTSASPSGSPAEAKGLIGPSASRALAKLCPKRPLAGSDVPAEGSTPPVVSKLEGQVQEIRDLRFTGRVPVDAVTHPELVRGLMQTFDAAYPAKLFKRKSRAWATIGAIPQGTEIRQELEQFASSRVVGYYDEVSKYLVFLGSDDPTAAQLVTLAHELTHALDDQHFGLRRLDELAARCDDEGFEAALALAEGDATYVMVAYARRYLTPDEQLALAQQGGSTSGIDPFVLRLESWPYSAGLSFVQSLVNRGGEAAVNAAFRDPPKTTEQVVDPAAYPDDRTVAVDVPQLGHALGKRWRDLDVQAVGAAWLSILLGLQLDQERASGAVHGWEGGVYRAWTNGTDVAAVLRTAWETADDASRFTAAMSDWIADGRRFAEIERSDGTAVTALFASSGPTLDRLRTVL